ncbi:MAG: hypothetical protein ACRC6E_03035 [Fusobacteriaceae bacterium]
MKIKKSVSLYLEKEEIEKILKFCKDEKRSVSFIVSTVVLEYIKKRENKK